MKPLILLVFTALTAMASRPQPVAIDKIKNKVNDKFIPTPYGQQKIEGLLGERMKVNLEGRLLHVDEKGIMEGFQHRPGKQDWIGEHAGKFLHAAANTWEYTGDARLKTLMDRIAHELVATQLPDGYLGTYTDDKRWTSWDVWVHKYDLLGLLSYYRVTADEAPLAAAKKIGNLLVTTFGEAPGQRDIIVAGEHVGMAATSVLEPMVMLYRYTGDPRYLNFCYYITRAWDSPKGPRIMTTLNETGSVFKTANAKAYEMLSNLVGLVDLYRVSGDEKFLKPAMIAWKDVSSKRLYVTGTSSSKEHFLTDGALPGDEADHVGEGCVTVTWIQLNWQLLRLSGDAKYGDEIERAIYNQLLGAQDPQTGNICYFTPLNGKKSPTPGINCCVSSEPRGISMLPQLVWGTRENGIEILSYVPGEMHTGVASVKSETQFPMDGKVTLTIAPGKKNKFALYLRVPRWTADYAARVNGQKFTAEPGELVTIDRKWKQGDQVEISMDMTVHVIAGGPSYPTSVAIQRGPQVLAIEREANPGLASLEAAQVATMNAGQLHLRDAAGRLPKGWPGHQAYAIDGIGGTSLVLVPFADAKIYRVWIGKPPSEPRAGI